MKYPEAVYFKVKNQCNVATLLLERLGFDNNKHTLLKKYIADATPWMEATKAHELGIALATTFLVDFFENGSQQYLLSDCLNHIQKMKLKVADLHPVLQQKIKEHPKATDVACAMSSIAPQADDAATEHGSSGQASGKKTSRKTPEAKAK